MSQKNLFIVWAQSPSYKPNILGVYKKSSHAIKKCKKYNYFNKDHIMDRTENNSICEHASIIDFDTTVYCSKIKINKKIKTIFFLKITEYGLQNSYHKNMWLNVGENENMSLNIASDYFDKEHNRKKKCSKCPKCGEEMINSLKSNQFATITLTNYVKAQFELWSIDI